MSSSHESREKIRKKEMRQTHVESNHVRIGSAGLGSQAVEETADAMNPADVAANVRFCHR